MTPTDRLVLAIGILLSASLWSCGDNGSGPDTGDGDVVDATTDVADTNAEEDGSGDVADAADVADTDREGTRVSDNVYVGEAGVSLYDGSRTVMPLGWAEAVIDGESYDTLDCGTWELADVPGLADAPTPGARRTCTVAEFTTVETVAVLDDARFVLGLSVTNDSDETVVVTRMSPLVSEASRGGGLFVGEDAARGRILDDGTAVFLDIDLHTHIATQPPSLILTALLPIPHRGEFVSNWNHSVLNLDDGANWVAGTLSAEKAIPTFGLSLGNTTITEDGVERRGFAAFYADESLAFHGKPVEPGATLAAEEILVDFSSPTPHEGLERYARAISTHVGRAPWTDTHPVPNGWNSWTGSGSTGGLGTDIDEELILECLDVMAREFQPFGVDYYQIDDGYMVTEGDWVANDRFPRGMAAVMDDIADTGLIPGVWASPFLASDISSIAEDHPEWMLPRDNDVTNGAYVPSDDLFPLDFTNPEVVDWMRDLAVTMRDDWGIGWFKLDFAYFVVSHQPNYDRTLTTVEAYRRGLQALRDGLGEDAFFLGVGLLGVHWGIVDGIRTTLDDGPLWEEASPFTIGGTGNTLKNCVRTSSRRWYFQENLLVNHNDLLFFRTDQSHPDQPLTFEEGRSFASYIGLSGSIVKFGEDLRTLTPEQIRMWRRLLPVYGPAARPIDVYERTYPEVYHLEIDGSRAGWDASWDVVGLINWGRNWDLTGDRREGMEDAARTLEFDLDSLSDGDDASYLAHELWTWDFLGEVTDALSMEVGAHASALVALRPITGRPQLVGDDRHITQGGTDIIDESWDEDTGVLTLEIDVDKGSSEAVDMPVRVRFAVPAPFTFVSAELGDAGSELADVEAQTSTAHGYQLVDIVIEPETAGPHVVSLAFSTGS